MRKLVFAIVSMFVFAANAVAETEPPEVFERRLEQIERILSPQSILRGKLSEEDVEEVFTIMRGAMVGKTIEPSERLRSRLQAIGDSVQVRGALAGMLLLDELEAILKNKVREINRDPDAI